MKSFIIIALLILTSWVMATDIHLKNGVVIRNARIILQSESELIIQTSAGKRRFNMDMVEKIIETPYDPKKKTEVDSHLPDFNNARQGQTRITFPNLKLLPTAIIALALSYDMLKDANDIGKSIDQAPEGFDASELKSRKSRKQFLGFTFLVAGAINALISLKPVEVVATENTVGLSYKF